MTACTTPRAITPTSEGDRLPAHCRFAAVRQRDEEVGPEHHRPRRRLGREVDRARRCPEHNEPGRRYVRLTRRVDEPRDAVPPGQFADDVAGCDSLPVTAVRLSLSSTLGFSNVLRREGRILQYHDEPNRRRLCATATACARRCTPRWTTTRPWPCSTTSAGSSSYPVRRTTAQTTSSPDHTRIRTSSWS
jgi:hypothetical protein